jgi:PAS domain S-box-containing protein
MNAQFASPVRFSEDWWRVTLSSIGDAVIVTDADGQVMFMNAVAESLTGWGHEAASGRPFEEVFTAINEASRARVESPILTALRTGTSVGLANNTLLLTKTGAEVPVEDSAAPIRDERGNVFGAVLVFRDASERKRAEAERAYLAAIVESSDDAVVSKTLESTITSWNKAAERIFGYTAAEVIGRSIRIIIPPDRQDEEDMVLERLGRGERIDHYETVRRRKDGTLIDVSLTISPIKDGEGRIIGASKIARDITEKKRMEERLREVIRNLRQTEEVLRENDRRKDEFLAMLAHELRNPLAPIRNAARVLRHSPAAHGQAEQMLDIIERQAEHLTRLVDDLLDVSRITRGKITLQRERLELMTVVSRAVETSRPLIDAARHRLTVRLPPEPVRVEGDLTRLAQVISNLLNNAAKYTEPGGQIELRAEREGDEVFVRVKDNGVGIPPQVLPRVFDLFAQDERSLDRSQGGLGIGLTLVRSLIELHGGSVEARSEGLGHGSEFTVRLPVLSEPQDPERPPSGIVREGGAVAPGCCRILLVEDNADSAESMALLLRLDGHEVRTARDGAEAVEVARSICPQVALLDIGLPEMDGYEVARRLRVMPEAQRAVMIALTGYGQPEDRRRSHEAGFDHHLTKPIDYDVLASLIRSLVLK